MILAHGTCISIDGAGVLLRGPSGSGKSDLALRLLNRKDLDILLVADDQVYINRRGDALWAAASDELASLIEVRGVGLVAVDHMAEVRLRLVLDLCSLEGIPRLPQVRHCTIEGVTLPLYPCASLEASAPDKVVLLARSLDVDILRS